jgi:hypothetical protein
MCCIFREAAIYFERQNNLFFILNIDFESGLQVSASPACFKLYFFVGMSVSMILHVYVSKKIVYKKYYHNVLCETCPEVLTTSKLKLHHASL